MRQGRRALVLTFALAAIVMAGRHLSACRFANNGPRDGAAGAAVRAVADMRGVSVNLPLALNRVVTIDDGFVEAVMTRLGTIRTLVAVGSSSQQRTWRYPYSSGDGRSLTVVDGMGTMRALHPWIAELPCASRTSGEAINYETIAAARPQVVILRAGDCTIGTSAEVVSRTTGVFAAMGIPTVVLRSPADFRGHGLDTLRREIEVLGQVFGKEREALELAGEMGATETMIQSRVRDVPGLSRPRVLYVGLAPGARASGGAAYVWGTDTTESWMIERILGARNAYRGPGARVLLNAEQILALDPDVIFLPTSAGYHPPQELAEAPAFRDLRRLRAVRERRVYPLPWSPMNCARRLEYPLDLLIMAKGTFPDRFRDVAVHEWALAFYRRTYLVDEPQALALRRAQWLEWTVAAGF
jgi:iron complex transport system substrate-binding protein